MPTRGNIFICVATILLRMLPHPRCSCSHSTHRCSSSDTKHRHWNRCSRYPPPRECLAVPLSPYRGRVPPYGGTISISSIGGGYRRPDCDFTIMRPPYHRVSCQSDHRKRPHPRGPCPHTTHRRTRPDTKHRHWNRSSRYPPPRE